MASASGSSVLSVNLARVRPNADKDVATTGIDKRPAEGSVDVRAPGSKADGLGSGLVGDHIGDRGSHGGDDQAVYAYAREDLDDWEGVLGRSLSPGSFGENLTTLGLDVTGALIGERWAIGQDVELQVTDPRIPCSTFRGWIGTPGWLRTFTEVAKPGAYLRVLAPGSIAAGDTITVTHRPAHAVTIGLVFRAMTREPELLTVILAAADDLPTETVEMAREGRTFSIS
jgi:MOSC domain-containing protein YiiM